MTRPNDCALAARLTSSASSVSPFMHVTRLRHSKGRRSAWRGGVRGRPYVPVVVGGGAVTVLVGGGVVVVVVVVVGL